jgi:hypothetical protein
MRVNTKPYIVVFDSGCGFGVRGPKDFEEFGHRKYEHAIERAVELRRQRLWLAADGVVDNEDLIDRKTGEWDDDVNSPANAGNQTIPETELGEMVDKDREKKFAGGKNRVPGGEGPDDANFSEVDPNKSKAIKVPSSEKDSNASRAPDENEGEDPFKELPKRFAASDGEVHQAFRQANQHSRVSEPHHTQPVPYMAGMNPNHPANGMPTLSANNYASHAQSGIAPGMTSDPPVSQAQRAAMHAAAEGHGNIGIPPSVGREFSNADPGGKLPAHAHDFARFLADCNMDAKTISDACGMMFGREGKDCHY